MPVVLLGPSPQARDGYPAPLGFCAVCAAAWKATAFETQGPAVQAADKAPTTTTLRLTPSTPPPSLAVAYGLTALPVPQGLPGGGSPAIVPLPLCWTHLTAVAFLAGGIIPAPPGAVLLDGSSPFGPPPGR